MSLTDVVTLPWWVVIGSVLVAIFVYFFRKYYEDSLARHQAVELKLAERKQELYMDFMTKFWGPVTQGDSKFDGASFLQEWNRRMIFTASDDVLGKVQALQHASVAGGNYMKAGAELFIAMRRDMGHANTRVTAQQMLRSIVKAAEWDEVDKMLAGSWQPKTQPPPPSA
jgi:hypothetical protein